MKRFVLDAWAILALLQREEPAAERVKGLFEEAALGNAHLFISIINLGEVFYRIGKIKGESSATETLNQIRQFQITVLPASGESVWAAARIKMLHPISFADAFAAAAAEAVNAMLVTGDPELTQLSQHFRIEKLQR
ncbi:MAG: type II toxin-antitoxin system VapC family toxin [Chloroflexota bacterium]